MITETLVVGGGYYLYKNWDDIKLKRKWKRIMASGAFTNRLGKSLKLWEINRTDYGFDLIIELPYSYTFSNLEEDVEIFKEALGVETIELSHSGNMCTLNCVEKKDLIDFVPYPLPPYELLIGDGLRGPITVNLNRFPNVLIAGDIGTGKSRLLFGILTNLIATCTEKQIEINLMQLRKNDLEVFRNCKQVRVCAKTLEQILTSLREQEKECMRREPLIDPTKGIYSIADYNKKHPDNQLKYNFTVFEEFATLNPSKGDTKDEADMKKECIGIVKRLIILGRASGMFSIIALQKPTSDSLDSAIKSQLFTRISLRIDDDAPAIVIMGNKEPTKLGKQEIIVRTLGKELGHTYTIQHHHIMQNIKKSVVKKQTAITETTTPTKILKYKERLLSLRESD